jgi:hypothetical protein
VGQNFVPEIFLGRANVTGTATAFFQDSTLIADFKNETEVSILAYLTTTSAVNSPACRSIAAPEVWRRQRVGLWRRRPVDFDAVPGAQG